MTLIYTYTLYIYIYIINNCSRHGWSDGLGSLTQVSVGVVSTLLAATRAQVDPRPGATGSDRVRQKNMVSESEPQNMQTQNCLNLHVYNLGLSYHQGPRGTRGHLMMEKEHERTAGLGSVMFLFADSFG